MSDTAKHIPGPWRVDRHNADYPGGGWFIIQAGTGTLIGKVHDGVEEIEHDQFVPKRLASCDATARLIAAAPDLLAALEAVLAFEEDSVSGPWPQAVAAIKKARGE